MDLTCLFHPWKEMWIKTALSRYFILIAHSIAIILLTSCATIPNPLKAHLESTGTSQACAEFFVNLDTEVKTSGVRDAGAEPITGYPYLRVTRFLASFKHLDPSSSKFDAWIDHLQALDQQARKYEIMNLPHASLIKLSEFAPTIKTLIEKVHQCGNMLRNVDLNDLQGRRQLLASITVPTEYQTYKRIFGLYPITSLFVKLGVRNWHDSTRDTFSLPLGKLPIKGKLDTYGPGHNSKQLTHLQVESILKDASDNPLQIPEISTGTLQSILTSFAPVLEIDTSGDFDKIGAPFWDASQTISVDTEHPWVYTYASYVRFNHQILLQLNYVVWFSARPKTGACDLLGGRLDGITWRVTLNSDGRPLIYDSIHNCGCYQMFFPTRSLRLEEPSGIYVEPPLVPQQAPQLNGDERMVLRIATRTHYLQRIYPSGHTTANVEYDLQSYQQLRSLPLPGGGRKSLFGANGIVPGTERAERWIFWPMGIPEPGAMRQAGTHATAFVGKRYFDDPDLFKRFFVLRNKVD
jgi:hypothetical protein